MKVFYESKLAKALTFMANYKTIMFLGMVFTEKSELNGYERKHEETHCFQYRDCFATGLAIAIVVMFVLFAFNVCNWHLLWLTFIPLLLFYVWYGVEYTVRLIQYKNTKDAHMNVSFEKQAYQIAETWNKPCSEQKHYYSFGWIL